MISALQHARMRIARAGERDAMRWWESEALSPGGDFVLGRLFPRSKLKAAWRLSLEAARVKHAALCPKGSVNVFDLGPRAEQLLAISIDASLPIPVPARSAAELRSQLVGAGLIQDDLAPDASRAEAGAFALGLCPEGDPASETFLATWIPRLVAGYLSGDLGRPVLPYLEMT